MTSSMPSASTRTASAPPARPDAQPTAGRRDRLARLVEWASISVVALGILARIRGSRRAWLVFIHIRSPDGFDESDLIVARARTFARRVDVVGAHGALAVPMERR